MKYESEVKRGMELLDKLRPGWRDEIRVDYLDLGCCSLCVLGQVFGDYDHGLNRLRLELIDSRKYGFSARPDEYPDLQCAWENALLPAVDQ